MRPEKTECLTESIWHTASDGQRVYGPCRAHWDGKPKRAPKAGEYFMSGARVTAYKAKQDMTQEYFIAVLY